VESVLIGNIQTGCSSIGIYGNFAQTLNEFDDF